MKKHLINGSIIALLFSPGFALAENACLLETNTLFMGVQLDIKDCIQNAGMDANSFKAQCEGMSQAVVAMGGPAAEITYLPSCPEPFQARCDNSRTAKTMFFYYKRSADEYAGLKSGCDLMRGIYTKGALE